MATLFYAMSEVSSARRAAVYVLGRCRRFDAWSVQTLSAAKDKFSLDNRDEAFCTRLCLCVLQNAALCDFYIDCYSSVKSKKLQPQVLDILRLGICQLLFLSRVPESAAVHQCVELCKEIAPKASGLVNGVLHRVAENKDALPSIPGEGSAEYLSIKFSHPRWLCERLVQEKGYCFAHDFLAANNLEPSLHLAVNEFRTNIDLLSYKLKINGLNVSDNSICRSSLNVIDSGSVSELPGFSEGEFFVQDAAASASVQSLPLSPFMRVLDACAAPGGKSFQCASLMRNQGEIISCDLHEKKLSLIDEGAQRLGFDCIQTLPMDASKPYDRFAHSFDAVIADVPCSGLGVIRKKPEIRYKKAEDIASLPIIQSKILFALSKCVKDGGYLLYSTCTILSEENEDVTSEFLNKESTFELIEEKTFWPQIDKTDGFYYCLMRKK